MFSKNARPYDASALSPRKRLRRNIVDLMASNTISGARAQELLNDAWAAGDAESRRLVAKEDRRHAARNLRRHLLRHTQWPSLYTATIRVWDPARHAEAEEDVSILLPHEVLAMMVRIGSESALYAKGGLDAVSRAYLERCEALAGEPLVPLGLWGDGAPCNWDRSETLDIFSLNLPGISGDSRSIRIPLTGLSHRNVLSKHTFDDILAVVAWSLQWLALGEHPPTRHDRQEWRPNDKKRRARAQTPLGVRGTLVEVRGDWKFFKETFNLPGWQGGGSICWRCFATMADLRDVGPTARWRQQPKDHWDVVKAVLDSGATLSPLFSIPWFTKDAFRIDWLHAVDLGVAADFAGNLFQALLETAAVPGGTKTERCTFIWREMQEFYAAAHVQDKLKNLTPGMICGPRASPKLRASAAQMRALVPFCKQLAERFLGGTPEAEAIKAAASNLCRCYEALSSSSSGDDLASCSRRFAAQFVALEQISPERRWRVKPKMHMFLELAAEGSNPSLCWTYRDEDFGGTCARLSRRRGGLLKAQETSTVLLQRFLIKQPPICLR